MICKGNKISPEKILIDTDKDIDGYVSKLADVIKNKIEWMNRIGREIDNAISEIMNETKEIEVMRHKMREIDNDILQPIDDKLTEILKKSIKNLRKIVTQEIWLCHKTLQRIKTTRISK